MILSGRRLLQSALAVVLAMAPVPGDAQSLPESSLAIELDGKWHEWWRAGEAPVAWRDALPIVRDAIEWESVHEGLDVAGIDIGADGLAWRLHVVLVRVDPASVRLALDMAVRDAGLRGAWSIDAAPRDAVLAVNAGQFTGGMPWGWLVRDGVEVQPPGTGVLSMALVVDTAGGVRLLPVDSITAVRGEQSVAQAFQSYPALLRDGVIPEQLRAEGRGVDVAHRDSRLAIGLHRDGHVIVALTRFDGLGGAGGALPFGPTTPEMAALMGALGCRTAMLLDGGLSAQMLVRGGARVERRWEGMRLVPLGLVAW